MRGRFSWCDHHGVRGSPPLGSPTRRPPRPPQPRSPAPYRGSRSVLRKLIGRLHPRSTEPPRGSMRGRVVKKDGNFADERWPRRREFRIRDRFCYRSVLPGGRWSVVHRRHKVRDYEQRPWRKKRCYHVSSRNDTREALAFVDRRIYKLENFLRNLRVS